jgi:hypothetical protein
VTVPSTLLSNMGLAPLATDQRGPGFSRKVDHLVDIGALELQMNLDKSYSFHSSKTNSVTFTIAAPGLLLGSSGFPTPEGGTYQVVLEGPPMRGENPLVVHSDGSFTFTVPPRFRHTVQFNFRVVMSMPEQEPQFTNLIFTATIHVLSNGGGRGSSGAFLGS